MKKYLAEMVGTMVLVLMGCGVAVSLGCDPVNNIPAVVGTAFAFGLAVVAMAYTIGGISGCHINPAITLGCIIAGRMDAKEGAMYMIFQCIGAFIGSALLYVQRCYQQLRWSGYRSEPCTGPSGLHPLYRYFCESRPFIGSCRLPRWYRTG